ncbi:MAG: glycosyltransferase [Treponema sp.]
MMWGLLKLTKDLKILFIPYTHSNGGGAEAVLTTLVNNLPKTWKIDILEVVNFGVKKEATNENIRLLPPLTRAGDSGKACNFFYISILYKPQIIKHICKLEDYDVVIGWEHSLPTFFLLGFDNCKKIVWFHGMLNDFKNPYSILTMRYYDKKENFYAHKKVLDEADQIAVTSNMCLRSLIEVFPEYKEKSRVIYNGTDIEKINENSKVIINEIENPIFYNKVLQKEEPYLILIGHINNNKNFSLALNALKILKDRNIVCNIVILGNGDSETDDIYMRDMIVSLGIQDRIFLLGYKRNPLPFLSHSKLLLITSFSEGFPTVVTEAMALGIPFITTPVAGASEELANNGACGLVSDWNAEEYANKIEKLLTDEVLYQTMSQNCKEHIKNYSVENYVASFKKMVEDIPEKNIQNKSKNRSYFISIILFIFYSAFYLSINNHYKRNVVKMRWFNLVNEPCFLNVCKFIFRFGICVACVLSFPLRLLHISFLTFRYMMRKEI